MRKISEISTIRTAAALPFHRMFSTLRRMAARNIRGGRRLRAERR